MSRKMEVCAFGMSVLMSLSAFAKDATDGLVGWWRVEKGENGAVLKASDLRIMRMQEQLRAQLIMRLKMEPTRRIRFAIRILTLYIRLDAV